jgi:hypothetical protein
MLGLLGKFAVAVTHGIHIGQLDASATDDGNVDTAYGEGFQAGAHGVPLARSLSMTTAQDEEEDLPETLETEKKAAFYARLGIACSLFLTFWMV